MKFCYVDESGYGNEPIFVMAGIITDVSRMHMTKREWQLILEALSSIIEKPITEFHTRHFYRGNGIWHDLDGPQRRRVMDFLLGWLKNRHHTLAFTAIDKAKACAQDWTGKEQFLKKRKLNYWLLGALHFLLCIQKEHQTLPKTKGHTLLILDHEVREEVGFTELVLSPPEWTDTYYSYDRGSRRKDNPPPLSHIVDVPYFVDSRYVGMLHVADLLAYLIRHYAELASKYTEPAYAGEKSVISDWMKQIAQFMLPDRNRWVARGACECATLFRDVAPDVLLRVQAKYTK